MPTQRERDHLSRWEWSWIISGPCTYMHAAHVQLFRIILTNKEQPLRIEREVSS